VPSRSWVPFFPCPYVGRSGGDIWSMAGTLPVGTVPPPRKNSPWGGGGGGGGPPFSPEGGGGEPPPSPLPPLPHRPPLSNTIGGPQEGGMGGDVYGVAAAALRMNFARRIAKGGGGGPIGGTNQNQGKDPLPGTQD